MERKIASRELVGVGLILALSGCSSPPAQPPTSSSPRRCQHISPANEMVLGDNDTLIKPLSPYTKQYYLLRVMSGEVIAYQEVLNQDKTEAVRAINLSDVPAGQSATIEFNDAARGGSLEITATKPSTASGVGVISIQACQAVPSTRL